MTAARPGRRTVTARELAERFNRSPRTIRRIVAEPREVFELALALDRPRPLALRAQGLSYAQIASELDISRSAAAGLVRRGRQNTSPKAVA